MIELNLIEAASQSVSIPVTPVTKETSGSVQRNFPKPLIAVAALLVVIVGFFGCLKVVGIPALLEGALPTPLLGALGIEDPSRSGPEMNVRRVSQMTTAGGGLERRKAEEEAAAVRLAQANSPERVVQSVQPGMFQNEKRSGYAAMFPMVKIVYQKTLAAQVFEFINAITPEGVSFAELSYMAPNFYSVRGVAETPLIQRNYLERLKMGSSEFKTPELPENAPATAVTAYGVLNAKPDMTKASSVPFVKDDEVAKEIDLLKKLDANGKLRLAGLKHAKVEDFGVYKSYTYNVTTKADFVVVLKFLQALSQSPARVGIERIKMSASGKKGVSTSMTLVVYSSN